MALTDPAPPRSRASGTVRPGRAPVSPISARPRLPYYPALDGLRAVAVLGVLLFHAGWKHASGGFLGVSTFFTLSGFLITTLLLVEKRDRGGIDARRFWSRRFRRLMPAAWITLAVTVVYGSGILDRIGFAADAAQLAHLRGDVVAALAYVANWRFLFDTQSYADLFSAESPVLHFWSLAIEEQFYVLFPLLVLVVLGARRTVARRFGMIVLALAAFSALEAVAFGFSDDRIYYGTDTRASELLVGALLAIVLHARGSAEPRTDRGRVAVPVAGAAGLVGILVIWATTSLGSGWLYRGGFSLYAVVSAVVIVACLQPGGPVARVLAHPTLVWLGRVSYGVYLFHWIIFLWLRQRGTLPLGFTTVALDTWWKLFLAGGALAVGLAAVSFYVVEQPVRRRRLITTGQARVVIPVAALALVAALFVVTDDPPPAPIDFAAAQELLDSQPIPAVDQQVREAEGISVIPPAPPPPRVSIFGDSTALLQATGLNEWMQESGEAVPTGGRAWLGCSLGRGGERRLESEVARPPQGCDDWEQNWAAAIDEEQPDVAVVQVGVWEAVDRKLPGDDQWRAPGDPVYDEFLLGEMRTAVDVLSADGAVVVWLTSPPTGPNADPALRDVDAARVDRLNELMRQVSAERPDRSLVVDYADYLAGADDERLRPDGVHTSTETAVEVADDFLGPAIVDAFDANYVARWRAENAVTTMPDPLRVLVVGDSTAGQLYIGLDEYNRAEDAGLQLAFAGEYGCGVGRGGHINYQGFEGDVPPKCDWEERYSTAVETFAPHVVVMLDGPFDVTDRIMPGDDEWRHVGDERYDEFLRSEFDAAADVLTSDGAVLVWLSSPVIDLGRMEVPPPTEPYPASDPDRMAALNEIILELADDRDDTFVVDYAGYLRDSPGGELSEELRPDGVHLTTETGITVAGWMVPELRGLYQGLIEGN